MRQCYTCELIGNSAVHKSEFWQQAARAPHVWSTSDCMTESLHPVPQLTGFLALLSSSSWPLGNSCSNELASSLNRPTSSQFFRKRVGVGVWSGIERARNQEISLFPYARRPQGQYKLCHAAKWLYATVQTKSAYDLT